MRRSVLIAVGLLLAVGGCGPREPGGYLPPLPDTAPAEPFTHPSGIAFVVLPRGKVESRVSTIELRRPVLMSACEITNAQYEAFEPDHERPLASPGDDHPVGNVTPRQAGAFCRWLTEQDELGRTYRLPDAVEWEYAARGKRSYRPYPWGKKIDHTRACYNAEGTQPVGSFRPNHLGLYDVAGNVAEWVRTDDVPEYELRGGSWRDHAEGLRILARGKAPDDGSAPDYCGFRVLCEPPPLR